MLGWIIAWLLLGMISCLTLIVLDVKMNSARGRSTDITLEMVLMTGLGTLAGLFTVCFIVYVIWEHYDLSQVKLFTVGGKKNGSVD